MEQAGQALGLGLVAGRFHGQCGALKWRLTRNDSPDFAKTSMVSTAQLVGQIHRLLDLHVVVPQILGRALRWPEFMCKVGERAAAEPAEMVFPKPLLQIDADPLLLLQIGRVEPGGALFLDRGLLAQRFIGSLPSARMASLP
jgi:hypothetical protein